MRRLFSLNRVASVQLGPSARQSNFGPLLATLWHGCGTIGSASAANPRSGKPSHRLVAVCAFSQLTPNPSIERTCLRHAAHVNR